MSTLEWVPGCFGTARIPQGSAQYSGVHVSTQYSQCMYWLSTVGAWIGSVQSVHGSAQYSRCMYRLSTVGACIG